MISDVIRAVAATCALVALAAAGGCAQYTTPGRAASFRAMGITEQEVDDLTDVSIARKLDRRPTAGFPASIAVVRVQDAGYRAYRTPSYGYGSYSVVSVRDVEAEDAFERIRQLPMVRGLAPLNRLVLPERCDDERDLRAGAAAVQADMLFIYTFDTVFGVEDKMKPLSVFTLGLFPQDEARVTSSAIGVLVDTRTGYVYGLAEGTAHEQQLANAWTSESAVDQSRRRAERQAFEKLVDSFVTAWNGVVREYGPPVEEATAAVSAEG